MGAVPALVAEKAGIFPVPLAARPMDVLLLVQVNVVPAPTGLETTVTGTPMALHQAWLGIGFTVGVGFTVNVKVNGVPIQPFAVGVMVILELMGDTPGLVAVKAGMSPVPLAARPMAVLVLVHKKVVAAPTGLVTSVIGTEMLLQYVLLVIGFTVGMGCTVTIYGTGKPIQLPILGVSV